ncbi:hypothetical protein PV05_05515 [Exophiala xenobiotica]|uniref:Heterokaryon incompatibility domain-containing protein n=1 Tax=Exophiala xenobiotica TaxID=348802 RepID=A0A0D2ENA1_9EURO|nr:uncharacterized protein PV05_05515 [Exophiala xenobiotica]KIW56898.1 hypothetical protein PV05_05515 [Exophiala xenobiotica]
MIRELVEWALLGATVLVFIIFLLNTLWAWTTEHLFLTTTILVAPGVSVYFLGIDRVIWYYCLAHYLSERQSHIRNALSDVCDQKHNTFLRRLISSDQTGRNKDTSSQPSEPPNSNSDNDAEAFPYEPLSGPDIRLLKLVKSSGSLLSNLFLNFQLVHVSINDAQGNYCAVSYCWGDQSKSHTIYVNDQPFKIRSNLADLLRDLCPKDREGALYWVDAVCINQDDLIERGSQVSRMKRIFGSAGSVKAWVGQAHPYAGVLYHFLGNLQSSAPRDPKELEADIESLYNRYSFHEEERLRLVEATMAFIQNPYWSRVWVVQEFALNSNLSVLWGGLEFRHQLLALYLRFLLWLLEGKNSKQLGLISAPIALTFKNLMFIRDTYQNRSEMSLINLLIRSNHSKCTDKKDKVFGFLSLASDGEQYIPDPDYRADLVDLRFHMTKRCISRFESLNVILHGPRDGSLPSWCPAFFDLDTSPFRDSHFIGPPIGQKPGLLPNHATVGGLIRELKTPARRVGTIRSLGWTISDGNTDVFPTSDQTDRLSKAGFMVVWSTLLDLLDDVRQHMSSQNEQQRNVPSSQFPNISGPLIQSPHLRKILSNWLKMKARRREDEGHRQQQWKVPSSQSPNIVRASRFRSPDPRKGLFNIKARPEEEKGQHRQSLKQVYAYALASLFHQNVNPAHPEASLLVKWVYVNRELMMGGSTLGCYAAEINSIRGYLTLVRGVKSEFSTVEHKTVQNQQSDQRTDAFFGALMHAIAKGLRLALIVDAKTKKGSFGWMHPNARLGDEVFHIRGCSSPVILRTVASTKYRIIGEAMVSGFKDVEGDNSSAWEWKTIV